MFTFEPANYIENEAKDSVFFVIFDQSILSFSNENFIRPITQDELTWSFIEEKERHFLGYLNKKPCFVILSEKISVNWKTQFLSICVQLLAGCLINYLMLLQGPFKS